MSEIEDRRDQKWKGGKSYGTEFTINDALDGKYKVPEPEIGQLSLDLGLEDIDRKK